MDLKTYQQQWQHALLNSEYEQTSSSLGVDPAILKLYSQFTHSHYEESLVKMYPRISEMTSLNLEDYSKDYYKNYPAKHWELNELVKNFNIYLSQQENIADYISELASYEWMEFAINLSTADEHVILNSLMPNEIALNPTLEALELKYDIANWVKDFESHKSPSKPVAKANILLCTRSIENNACITTNASRLTLQIIQYLIDNKSDLKHMISALSQEGISTAKIESEIVFLSKQSILLTRS